MLSSLKVSLSFNSTCLFSNSQNSISISNIQRLSHLDHYLTLNSLEHTTWAKPHSCPLFGVEAQDSKDDGGMRAEQRGRNSKLKLVPSSHSAAGILWLQAPLVSGHVTGEGEGCKAPVRRVCGPTGLLAPSHQSFSPGILPFLHCWSVLFSPSPQPCQGSCQGNQVPCPSVDASPKPVSGESGSPSRFWRGWGWMQMQTASDRRGHSQGWAWGGPGAGGMLAAHRCACRLWSGKSDPTCAAQTLGNSAAGPSVTVVSALLLLCFHIYLQLFIPTLNVTSLASVVLILVTAVSKIFLISAIRLCLSSGQQTHVNLFLFSPFTFHLLSCFTL